MFYSIARLKSNIRILLGSEDIVSAGGDENSGIKRRALTEIVMQIGISIVIIVAALWVLISRPDSYSEDIRKYMYGLIGLVVGYWLR